VLTLDALLHPLLDVRASDLHLKVGAVPHLRVDGALMAIPGTPLTKDDLDAFVATITDQGKLREAEVRGDLDFALSVAGVGRFRINLHRQRSSWGLVIRKVRTALPAAGSLGLPPGLLDLALAPRGLVIVAGNAASGRSTLAATLLDRVNETRTACIVTIEDPIEYLHGDKRSIVTQREVGSDMIDAAAGVRRALRQDADVVFVGHVPDASVADAVLDAASSGRFVITCVTAPSCGDAVRRLVELFPDDDRERVRHTIAATLRGIACQQLLPRADQRGRSGAVELLVGTDKVQAAILGSTSGPALTSALTALVADGRYSGMITFDQSIVELAINGVISRETALAAASDPAGVAIEVDRSGLRS
jgi:twitching motility protein PilT